MPSVQSKQPSVENKEAFLRSLSAADQEVFLFKFEFKLLKSERNMRLRLCVAQKLINQNTIIRKIKETKNRRFCDSKILTTYLCTLKFQSFDTCLLSNSSTNHFSTSL
jgi:hypothetical protein